MDSDDFLKRLGALEEVLEDLLVEVQTFMEELEECKLRAER